MTRPMLDGVELPQAQRIASEDEEVLAQHGVPALEGDFLQDLGRRAVRVTLTGVLTGPEVGEGLKGLREKFHAAEPVPFVSDIATATRVDKVLIEEMGVRELAGKTERFEYALSLREYMPPPAVTEEVPPVIPPPPVPVTATLVVEVIVEGEPDFDFSRVRVTATGSTPPISRTLTNRVNNVWTETDFPPGSYTVEAVVDDPDPMIGSAPAEVREGETTQVTITLSRDRAEEIAKAFVIHFWFDKAFVEPCLREVLQRVVAHSDAHPDEKVLIVGHTDLVGSDDYNQSLSERRGRSVHAYLTSGRDRAASVAEWNELRKRNPGGITIHDTWGTREYQYILQDLGFYFGNIDEDHGPATDAAVRAFQTDHGLTPDGVVGDATWEKLVEAYLDEDPLSIPEERFFRNAKGACDGGIVKWLGCGEQDPVLNTQDAWRPNRRTEILFIKADAIPCEVAKPVTFDLPSPGFVGTSWCLGPGNPAKRCCFLARKEPEPGKFLVRPAEPGKVLVQGTITFEDGTPVSNARYALIAPDGEYLHTTNGVPDKGERPSGPQRGRPIPNRADEQGRFSHPVETPEGVYILEIFELTTPQVARATEEPVGSGRGNVVCFRLDAAAAPSGEALTAAPAPPAGKGGVVQSAPAPTAPVNPTIAPSDPVVVVKRSYTSPARLPITLGVSARFRRGATLARSGDTGSVRLFTTRTGPTEFTFDASDQARLTGAQLSRTNGFTLFAESDTPTSSVGGYHLTLTLDAGSTPVGPPAVANVTAVRLTLDIFTTREPSGVAPVALPQPPSPPPPAATATDKWFKGGLVNVQDATQTQERVQLRIQVLEPDDFTGTLELRQLSVTGTTFGAVATRARGFENATPTPGETAVADPFPIAVGGLGFRGQNVFLEGVSASAAQRDTGFQLGVQGASADGDRVALTVGVGASITPASTLRAVLVKKPHTQLARQAITLRATAALPAGRQGTLTMTAASGAIRLFRSLTGTDEITNTANNVFPASQLNGTGVQVFAEGVSHCTRLDDIQIVLTLGPGSPAAGVPGSLRLTCVEVTLDVGMTRTAPGVDPPLLPEAQKGNPGRFVHVAHPNLAHERAMLITRPPNPAAFRCDLVLTPLSPLVQPFSNETPAAAQTPIPMPSTFPSLLVTAAGVRDFVQTSAPSAAARDTGFQLGIAGLDPDGDRIAMTGYGLALTNNTPPFDTPVVRVEIEGLLHTARASFDLSDLFGTQAASLFRARADVPGVAGNQVQAQLISRRADRSLIESHNLNLTRTSGDRFVSLPILAIPQDFPRADITFRAPQDIDVMRCQAGGTLRLELRGALANTGGTQVRVRGRVLEICTLTIQGASPNIAGNLATGNRVMAQAGIEVRILSQLSATSAALLDIQQADCPLTLGGSADRGTEETALFALGRSSCTSNFIVYFVRSNSLGLFGCSAFPAGQPGVSVADTATQYTFIHEIGHVLTLPHDGTANNLMTGAGTNSLPANPANVNLLAAQCLLMYGSGFLVLRGG